MRWFWLLPIILAAAVLLIAYICFRMAFYTSRKEPREEYAIPQGEIYAPYREQMVSWIKEMRAMPREALSITSHDGLTLRGRLFVYAPDAPIELMFHGYRGDGERDLCGGVQRCFALGHSALVVDQRGCGSSEGHVITFGVKEHRDCLDWLAYIRQRFGPEVKILLCGISMGASTVLMAAGHKLPENVMGVLADCGYSSARKIVQKVIRDMKLPAKLAYPFVRLGARIYGGFDLEEMPPVEALRRCSVPVLFFHGQEDAFVPCEMSLENYEACASRKKLVTVPGAGHGLSYLMDRQGYLEEMNAFFS